MVVPPFSKLGAQKILSKLFLSHYLSVEITYQHIYSVFVPIIKWSLRLEGNYIINVLFFPQSYLTFYMHFSYKELNRGISKKASKKRPIIQLLVLVKIERYLDKEAEVDSRPMR